jgi:hypothetical protein
MLDVEDKITWAIFCRLNLVTPLLMTIVATCEGLELPGSRVEGYQLSTNDGKFLSSGNLRAPFFL